MYRLVKNVRCREGAKASISLLPQDEILGRGVLHGRPVQYSLDKGLEYFPVKRKRVLVILWHLMISSGRPAAVCSGDAQNRSRLAVIHVATLNLAPTITNQKNHNNCPTRVDLKIYL